MENYPAGPRFTGEHDRARMDVKNLSSVLILLWTGLGLGHTLSPRTLLNVPSGIHRAPLRQ